MKILSISTSFPYPPNNGSRIRIYNTLIGLRKYAEITVVTIKNHDITPDREQHLRTLFPDSHIFPQVRAKTSLWSMIQRQVRAAVGNCPTYISSSMNGEMLEFVHRYVVEGNFDVVIAEDDYSGEYVRSVAVSIPKVYVKHNVNHVLTQASFHSEKRLFTKLKNISNFLGIRRYENNICSDFSKIITTTEQDRDALLKMNSNLSIEVLTNGVDFSVYPTREYDVGTPNLVFFGTMNYGPNVDAVQFFVHDILPHIRSKVPEATFTIVGRDPDAQVLALESEKGVHVMGTVESIFLTVHQFGVSVIPLRIGSGIKCKTLESLSMGIPTVSTKIGVDGISIDNKEALLVADDPKDFASCVVEILNNTVLRRKLAHNGFALVRENYAWDPIIERYIDILRNLSEENALS